MYWNNPFEPGASMLNIEFMYSIGALHKDATIFSAATYVIHFLKMVIKTRGDCALRGGGGGGQLHCGPIVADPSEIHCM